MGRVLTDALPSGPRGGRGGGAAVFPDVLRDALSSLPSSPLPKFPPHAFSGSENGKTFLRRIDETQTRTLPRPRDAKRRTAAPRPSDAKTHPPPSPFQKTQKGRNPQKRKSEKEAAKADNAKSAKGDSQNSEANKRTTGPDAKRRRPKTHRQTRHATRRTAKRTHSAKNTSTISAERSNGGTTRATPSHGATKRQ